MDPSLVLCRAHHTRGGGRDRERTGEVRGPPGASATLVARPAIPEDHVETTLPTRPLGTTDMAVTRVGFGAWAIGGADWAFGWGAQDDADSIAAIRHAAERGVNWI